MKKQGIILIIIICIASSIGIGWILLDKGELTTDEVVYQPTDKYSYYYYIPRSALNRDSIRIFLYTHGSPQVDNYKEMENEVRDHEIPRIKSFCEEFGYALLVVVTPRLWGDYPDYTMNSQSMNQWVMTENEFDDSSYDFYKRPDLEFIQALDSFKQMFQDARYHRPMKIYIGGFSNGGMIANRFTILHPENISATAIGAGGAFLYPMTNIEGVNLTYPIGIADLDTIPEIHYDLDIFKKIPQLIFVGENDVNPQNDPALWGDNFNENHISIISTYFGTNCVERAEMYSDYLVSIGMDIQFTKYENLAHDFTTEMITEMFEFFEAN